MNSEEELHTRLHPNLDLIRLPGREIYLLGTAHVSEASVNLVTQYVNELSPDTVAVELCASRLSALRDPDRWRKTDIVDVIRSGRAYVLIVQIVLGAFQRRIGKDLSIRPGAEMLQAVSLAEEHKLTVALVDREIRTTLKRMLRALSLPEIGRLIAAGLGEIFQKNKIDPQEIERIKSPEAMQELMEQFSDAFPKVRETLIDERNLFMAEKLLNLGTVKTLAVVGAGHVPGMVEVLKLAAIGQLPNVNGLEEVPSLRWSMRLFVWAVPTLIILMMGYTLFFSSPMKSWQVIKVWFWARSIAAAVGATVALAHPITIIASALIAPFFYKVGWVAALIEAALRRPEVEDFDNILDDCISIRGLWSNRVTRLLLILVTTSFAAFVGALIGGALMYESL